MLLQHNLAQKSQLVILCFLTPQPYTLNFPLHLAELEASRFSHDSERIRQTYFITTGTEEIYQASLQDPSFEFLRT